MYLSDTSDVFQPDPDYLENEEKYKLIKEEILGEGVGGSSESEGGSGDDSDVEEEEESDDGEV